jgi:hypothetical protein
MGNRFGGVAAVVAIGAALVLALGVVFTNAGGVDYAKGTYTFKQPATEYVDESIVLVQDGAVTDVWMSEADMTRNYYGYTPQTPATALQLGDDSAVTTRDGDTVRQCWFVGTESEHCVEFVDVTRLSGAEAARLSRWAGPADGEYVVHSQSVTWDEGSNSRVTITDGNYGVLSGGHDRDTVRYWIRGANEPFAICHDDPRSYDEEECWTWSEATDAKGV